MTMKRVITLCLIPLIAASQAEAQTLRNWDWADLVKVIPGGTISELEYDGDLDVTNFAHLPPAFSNLGIETAFPTSLQLAPKVVDYASDKCQLNFPDNSDDLDTYLFNGWDLTTHCAGAGTVHFTYTSDIGDKRCHFTLRDSSAFSGPEVLSADCDYTLTAANIVDNVDNSGLWVIRITDPALYTTTDISGL